MRSVPRLICTRRCPTRSSVIPPNCTRGRKCPLVSYVPFSEQHPNPHRVHRTYIITHQWVCSSLAPPPFAPRCCMYHGNSVHHQSPRNRSHFKRGPPVLFWNLWVCSRRPLQLHSRVTRAHHCSWEYCVSLWFEWKIATGYPFKWPLVCHRFYLFCR